jgi:hypothetical protein
MAEQKYYNEHPVIRFWDKVDKSGGCWKWTAARSSSGYGTFSIGSKGRFQVYAHRFAFEIGGGEIPECYELHHVCGNKLCVNPAHLKPVTPKEHKRLHGEEN